MRKSFYWFMCRGSKVFPSFVAVIKSPEGDDSKLDALLKVCSSDRCGIGSKVVTMVVHMLSHVVTSGALHTSTAYAQILVTQCAHAS